MSGKYLCYKFINKMVANHLMPDVEDWTCFFKLVGNMPIEFFSAKTIFDDAEGRKSTQIILNVTDKYLKNAICDYLNTLFTIKAMSVQIPKFGKEADLVLTGICRLMMSYDDSTWLASTFGIILESFDSSLQSSYL